MADFTLQPDLASRTFGGGIVYANDEFFAAADHLIDPAGPVFAARTFGSRGQAYDGWETRRRRKPGHDHVIPDAAGAAALESRFAAVSSS
jgi:allantoicase